MIGFWSGKNKNKIDSMTTTTTTTTTTPDKKQPTTTNNQDKKQEPDKYVEESLTPLTRMTTSKKVDVVDSVTVGKCVDSARRESFKQKLMEIKTKTKDSPKNPIKPLTRTS